VTRATRRRPASMLLPGPQILIYIALWVIMPKQRA
jgi:phage shock protein PspC (stress-responsive transcriptional regulator)